MRFNIINANCMKKNIAEFDNYGVNLSKTCQHKTVPGGMFSIILMAYSIYTIISNVMNYVNSPNHIAMKYLIDFQCPLAEMNVSADNVNGTVSVMGSSNVTLAHVFRLFKLAFEYNVDSSYMNTGIIILECVFNANSDKCSFNLPLKNEFFIHNHYSYYRPRITLQSCRSFKKQINAIENSHLLNDCADDAQIDDIYANEELMQRYLMLNIGTSNYQMLDNGTVLRFQKENNLIFQISKPNSASPKDEDSYIMEVEKMNVCYQNKLCSHVKENRTYINWQNPKMSNIELDDDDDDYALNVVFSFRLQEEIKFYVVTKTTLYETMISIGGFLGLVGVIALIPNLWIDYYCQKVLFQVYDVYHHNNEDKDTGDVDWKQMGYCKWFWLTCCCNPDKRRKAIKKKFSELLKAYQCKSCVKMKQHQKWFDLSMIMRDETNNEQDEYDNDVSNFENGSEFKEMEYL